MTGQNAGGVVSQSQSGRASTSSLSPRTVWGKVTIYLREHGAVALHIACGDINDVAFDGEKFVIRTDEDFLYELLKSPENQKDLKEALKSCGIEDFEIVKKEKIFTKCQRDLHKLKQIFGEELIIEGD